MRERLLAVCLWITVFAWSTWIGGTLYQMLVIVPMWEEVRRMASTWIWADRLRFAVGIAAFVAVLLAFRQHGRIT